MDTELFNLVVQVTVLISGIVVGFGGIVPIVNGLKKALGISGRPVQVLAAVVAFALAGLGALAQGLLVPESFTPELFTMTMLTMLTLSQAEYGRWLRKQDGDPSDSEAGDAIAMAQAIGKS